MKNQKTRNTLSIFRLLYFGLLPIYIWTIKDINLHFYVIILSYIITAFFSNKILKTIFFNLLLAAFFYFQIFILLIISKHLGESVNPMLEAIKPGLKVFAILSGFPLIINGRLLDDLLVTFSIVKYPAICERKPKKLICLILFIVVPLSAIVFLLLPYQFKQVHYCLKLRNTLPLSNCSTLKMLRTPKYFIWDLHIEPVLVKTITDLPKIIEAIKQKGF